MPQRLLTLALLFLLPLLLVGWFARALSATPVSSDHLRLSGHSGGQNQALALQGTTLVAGNGPILNIVDVTNTAQPSRLGFTPLAKPITSLSLKGSIVYAGSQAGGLSLIDIAQPTAPLSLSQLLPAAAIFDLTTATNRLYVSHAGGLTSLDISDPARPISPTTLANSAEWRGLHIAGNRGLAITSNSQLITLDLSQPSQPITQAIYLLPGEPAGVTASGNFAYVVWQNCPGGGCSAGFTVLDISDPARPTFVAQRLLGSGRVGAAATAGGYLYLSRQGSGAGYSGAGLEIYDIATPALPSFAADYNVPGSYGAHDILLAGPVGYLAYSGAGLHLLDLTDPTNPAPAGSWAGPGEATALAAANGLAYIGAHAPQDRAELWILDPTAPQGPVALSQLRISQLTAIDDLAIASERAYLLGPRPDGGGGRLRLVDVTNPAAPQSRSQFDVAPAYHVAAAAGFAYVHDDNGLQIIDWRQPLTPTQVAGYSYGGAMALAADHLYIAAGDAGLHILAVNSPANATLLGSLTPGWRADGVAVQGDYAYVVAGSNGLRVIDITNGTAPAEVGGLAPGWQAKSVAVQGRYVLVGTAAAGVRVVDVGDPAGPIEVGHYWDGWTPGAVAASSGGWLVTAGSLGLYQLEQLFAVSGRVRQLNGLGASNIELSLSGVPDTQTMADGSFRFNQLPAGLYSITPTGANVVFSPTMRQIDLPPTLSDQDFLILPAPVSATLGAVGGSLIFTDTQGLPTTVSLPAGAVTETVTVVITPTVVADQHQLLWVKHAFSLAVYRNGDLQPDFRFPVPIEVAIVYSDLDLQIVPEASLSLRQAPTWLDAGQTCTPATAPAGNATTNTFKQAICQTGRFGLFGPVWRLFLPVVFSG